MSTLRTRYLIANTGNAFAVLGATFASLWHSLPESTLTWASAVAVAVAVFAFDGLRSLRARLN